MKEIRAYIQPHKLFSVVQALMEIPGFPGLTVLDCQGFGQAKIRRGQNFNPFVVKKRLEIFAADEQVKAIVDLLMKEAYSGRPGDGKVYIMDVLEGGRIRTREWGSELG